MGFLEGVVTGFGDAYYEDYATRKKLQEAALIAAEAQTKQFDNDIEKIRETYKQKAALPASGKGLGLMEAWMLDSFPPDQKERILRTMQLSGAPVAAGSVGSTSAPEEQGSAGDSISKDEATLGGNKVPLPPTGGAWGQPRRGTPSVEKGQTELPVKPTQFDAAVGKKFGNTESLYATALANQAKLSAINVAANNPVSYDQYVPDVKDTEVLFGGGMDEIKARSELRKNVFNGTQIAGGLYDDIKATPLSTDFADFTLKYNRGLTAGVKEAAAQSRIDPNSSTSYVNGKVMAQDLAYLARANESYWYMQSQNGGRVSPEDQERVISDTTMRYKQMANALSPEDEEAGLAKLAYVLDAADIPVITTVTGKETRLNAPIGKAQAREKIQKPLFDLMIPKEEEAVEPLEPLDFPHDSKGNSTAPTPAPAEATVRIIHPDGRHGRILASELDAALKKGAIRE